MIGRVESVERSEQMSDRDKMEIPDGWETHAEKHQPEYVAGLRAAMAAATMEQMAVCRAWHGDRFAWPGYGSESFVVHELALALTAIHAPDGFLTSELAETYARMAADESFDRYLADKRSGELEAALREACEIGLGLGGSHCDGAEHARLKELAKIAEEK